MDRSDSDQDHGLREDRSLHLPMMRVRVEEWEAQARGKGRARKGRKGVAYQVLFVAYGPEASPPPGSGRRSYQYLPQMWRLFFCCDRG